MAAASADPFKLDVSINPTGWGPTKDSVPKEFVGKPFQAFKLSDSLGTVADFTGKHHNRRWYMIQPPFPSFTSAIYKRCIRPV